MSEHSHQSIREAIRERLAAGEWAPGGLMPGETALAEDYRCARTTVNRALQSLADEGLIERKRRAGTRVIELPVRRAKFEIPIVRHEIEANGARYHPHILLNETMTAPDHIAARLRLEDGTQALHLQTLHLADGRPHAFEDRWVNIEAAPGMLEAPLDEISANEWLVRHAPYSSGDVAFSASAAAPREAAALEAREGDALFTIERTTWREESFITTMKLFYRPGYKMVTQL
ncbi:GntR family transcriptional regulator [Hyphococcus luteus]|uniref:GntR family transcriptional regulator n=1 Tax=Hyphococcus luteus TaxID=2058213 RepID=A0A2S7KAG9_9PROT|nr:GntR family transcriptional regulator [Marinicaulis flavus]PQA89495.1 GntR family transcriptional regulator [Marinicaulis flavus]